ncbi:PD-(D/E)XK motif protein [Mycolicibacterium baixiangningiae]|uniref:PD-(D/E)XK motif protein n=1 Tax=Mycolicibacterium baixiangningiae TaxID=2761578 RepID=UPI0018D07B92|nr:PD-(D/E)XK motif protein [Mycolicibacterium baixiangningiae]
MSNTDNVGRHVPYAAIEAYTHQQVTGGFTVEGTPECRVQLSPAQRLITLLVQVVDNSDGPDLSGLANLTYSLDDVAGQMWHRLDLDYTDNLAEVYPVLCTILDRVQIVGEPFALAVSSVLSGLEEILANSGGLSAAKQIGLFGELTVLLSLAAAADAEVALRAWRGADREEHDFGLVDADLEVKTTASENRSHWISSLSQLVPSPNRPLFVASIQLTAAGSEPGLSLPQLVASARGLPAAPPSQLEDGLKAAGYHDRHAELYRVRWRLRSQPAFFAVDEHFPALTLARVLSSVPAAERIKDVRYRVDLDGLADCDPPFPIYISGLPT